MLGKSGQMRLKMIRELGKAELYRFDARKAATAMGHDKARDALKPARWVPPQDATWRTLEKWTQAALNVVLGTRLKIDGLLKGETREALRRFQKLEGLVPHGYLDERTLVALEARVGVHAPRLEGKEPLRRLVRGRLRVPPPKPKGRDEEDRDAERKSGAGPDGAELDAGHDRQASETANGQTTEQDSPRHRRLNDVLQREAEDSVAAMAFDTSFAVDAGAHVGRTPDAALLDEMQSWFQQAVAAGERSPDWVARLSTLARTEPEAAVETVRAAWLAAHPEKR